MNSLEHERHHGHGDAHPADSLNRIAFSATVHCLAGCSIGEVLGMVVGTAWGLGNNIGVRSQFPLI